LNFEDVEVSVVECPDLTQEPFNLASKGLCGNSRVLDIGGVPYLVPLAQKNKLYDMKDYPKLTGMSSKGHLISKYFFGVFKPPKKPTIFFIRISALAS